MSARRLSVASAAFATFFAATAIAGGPPIQAELALEVPAGAGAVSTAQSDLEGGTARVRVRVVNRADLRTAVVTLRFRYTIPPDTIALDEIIDRIVLETTTTAGDAVGSVTLDPNDVNLNPNGPRLRYTMTMYRPEEAYTLGVQIFGNYE